MFETTRIFTPNTSNGDHWNKDTDSRETCFVKSRRKKRPKKGSADIASLVTRPWEKCLKENFNICGKWGSLKQVSHSLLFTSSLFSVKNLHAVIGTSLFTKKHKSHNSFSLRSNWFYVQKIREDTVFGRITIWKLQFGIKGLLVKIGGLILHQMYFFVCFCLTV